MKMKVTKGHSFIAIPSLIKFDDLPRQSSHLTSLWLPCRILYEYCLTRHRRNYMTRLNLIKLEFVCSFISTIYTNQERLCNNHVSRYAKLKKRRLLFQFVLVYMRFSDLCVFVFYSYRLNNLGVELVYVNSTYKGWVPLIYVNMCWYPNGVIYIHIPIPFAILYL